MRFAIASQNAIRRCQIESSLSLTGVVDCPASDVGSVVKQTSAPVLWGETVGRLCGFFRWSRRPLFPSRADCSFSVVSPWGVANLKLGFLQAIGTFRAQTDFAAWAERAPPETNGNSTAIWSHLLCRPHP
ncbi:hypothetical protein RB8012 [Rhodopirellula baltica SH 1]|uniref:Uncharacterized protein n=1 Tax=Rhodopirellula baltica (strain DSM 10527 / NCIMB 13988 / SH1) TaxID=243090 RepID=Q7UGB0_RHOBA|nr:hypothetical protein RB8012 [Rhodopirellula baltica SH 1]